jgi:hypothetical protein
VSAGVICDNQLTDSGAKAVRGRGEDSKFVHALVEEIGQVQAQADEWIRLLAP